MSFRKLADISIAVGSYKVGDQLKQRQRKIGEIVEFKNDQTGATFQKVKLNGDALNSSLLIMARATAGRERAGDDSIMCSVWEEKEDAAPADRRAPAQTPRPPADPDLDVQGDDIPF